MSAEFSPHPALQSGSASVYFELEHRLYFFLGTRTGNSLSFLKVEDSWIKSCLLSGSSFLMSPKR